MSASLPAYLAVPPGDLGKGTPVKVTVVGDMADLATHFAHAILDAILTKKQQGGSATLILPVGPVDQYPLLADVINRKRISLRDVVLINMDEYLTDAGDWIDIDHPLSFRGYMNRLFYDRLDPALAPPAEHRVFPDPKRPGEIQKLIDNRGGVDVTFGGIGINGHIAFNEPPEPGEEIAAEKFAALPTRTLALSRETRTINANTVGGEISIIPQRAVTAGMKECLGARKLRFYCNRPWQSAVVRRVLHGPITPACPASFFRTHPDATITVCDYVAAVPNIQLR